MDKTVVLYSGFLLVGVFISSLSQVLLKKAALKKYDSAIKEYANPTVIIAYILFIGTTFLSVLAYKKIPLSLGAILEATGYFYITFFGVKIFGEKLNRKKLIALFFIVVGIIVYAIF